MIFLLLFAKELSTETLLNRWYGTFRTTRPLLLKKATLNTYIRFRKCSLSDFKYLKQFKHPNEVPPLKADKNTCIREDIAMNTKGDKLIRYNGKNPRFYLIDFPQKILTFVETFSKDPNLSGILELDVLATESKTEKIHKVRPYTITRSNLIKTELGLKTSSLLKYKVNGDGSKDLIHYRKKKNGKMLVNHRHIASINPFRLKSEKSDNIMELTFVSPKFLILNRGQPIYLDKINKRIISIL